jgi:hypothetical protein
VTPSGGRDTFILRFLHENKVDVWQGTNVGRWREISHECAGYTGYQRSHSTNPSTIRYSRRITFSVLSSTSKREGNSDLLDDLSERSYRALTGHNLKWHCLL